MRSSRALSLLGKIIRTGSPMPIPPPPAKYEPKMPTRIAPAPIGSGVSVRKQPVASIDQIAKTCEHWLAKSGGDYSHPATRHMFEMSHELKALIEPLRAEEARKDARLHHLEEIMAQWNECACTHARTHGAF